MAKWVQTLRLLEIARNWITMPKASSKNWDFQMKWNHLIFLDRFRQQLCRLKSRHCENQPNVWKVGRTQALIYWLIRRNYQRCRTGISILRVEDIIRETKYLRSRCTMEPRPFTPPGYMAGVRLLPQRPTLRILPRENLPSSPRRTWSAVWLRRSQAQQESCQIHLTERVPLRKQRGNFSIRSRTLILHNPSKTRCWLNVLNKNSFHSSTREVNLVGYCGPITLQNISNRWM